MKRINLLLFVAILVTQFNAFSVNTDTRLNIKGLELPGLIISEVRPDGEQTAYVELTNIGDSAIDLSSFNLHSVHYNTRLLSISDSLISFNRANEAVDNTLGKVRLHGMIEPDASFVVSTAWDADDAGATGIPRHNTAIAKLSDQVVHKDEELNLYGWINVPEWQAYDHDSVSYYQGSKGSADSRLEQLRAESSAGYLLQWNFQTDSGTVDSTYIDQFNVYLVPEYEGDYAFKKTHMYSIAGIADAMTTSVMVRKATIDKGNMNWDQSRGTDAASSEWLVLPKNTSKQDAFTSVGNHGLFVLNYTVNDPSTIVLDEGAKTISIPWEMVRGDSLSHYFDLGEGMTWSYGLNDVFEDTASYVARTGDQFTFYAVGNTIESAAYTLNVREPKSDIAKVFPRRTLIIDEEEIIDELTGDIDTVISRYWSNGYRFDVSTGLEVDSILNVSFATRVDTLFKYLDKPEKASWEIEYVDGKSRIDLMFGDILKVTAEDGTNVKRYVVAVEEHVLQSNAVLAAVTWPDVDMSVYRRWDKGDTLPDFTPLKTNYIVELDLDAVQIPALQFKTQDVRAYYNVVNAVDIDGSIAQRTTVVNVFAEDDTTILTYKIEFVRERTPVQPNNAPPFISEMIWNVNTQGCAVEIYNPGTEEIDLSQYMYVAGGAAQTWQEAVATTVSQAQYTSTDGLKIYQTHYVPSMRWANDESAEAWGAAPTVENPFLGAGFLRPDNQTDSWVLGGDVFVMGVGTSTAASQVKIREEADFIFRGAAADETIFAWDSTKLLHRETPIWNDPRHNMFLLKITNDSILDGTKNVKDAADYELVDRFEVIKDTIAGRKCTGKNWNLIRKSYITKGTLEKTGGGTSTTENSQWILKKGTDEGAGEMAANIGLHVMDPITNYLSTVTSMNFHVTSGYEGDDLSITGNIADQTPTTIVALLDKADASQTFAFMRGATEVAAGEKLAQDDILVVTSGDENSVTNYVLINSPLSDDVSLAGKAGSTITVSGSKVSGIVVDMKLVDLVEKLEVASTSVMNILDANGALQPMMMHNRDTLVYDVLVSNNIQIEVVAENSTKAIYTLDFGLASNEALLFSNILPIDQGKMMIMDVPYTSTAKSMLAVVFASEGASVAILDRAGFERVEGYLNVDDVVEVTAADGVTKVIYTFYDETTGIFAPRVVSVKAELFPNPVRDILNIRGLEVSSVYVYSLSGALMIEKTTFANKVDVSALENGIYVIRITDNEGRSSMNKFLKR